MFGFGFGVQELLIVAFIVLILFGSRLPSVMRSLGQGVVEFKKGVQGIEDDKEDSAEELAAPGSGRQARQAAWSAGRERATVFSATNEVWQWVLDLARRKS